MKVSFNMQTAKKIINEYAEQINILTKENKLLNQHVNDMKHSLSINKKLLYEHIGKESSSTNNMDLIKEIKQENTRLNQTLNKSVEAKIVLEQNLYKVQQELNDRIVKDNEIKENLQNEIFLLKNQLLEAEAIIENLRKINQQKKPVKEIYIADPVRANIELTNEVKASRDLVQNISKKYNQLITEKEQLAKQKDSLYETYQTLQTQTCNFQTHSNFEGIKPKPSQKPSITTAKSGFYSKDNVPVEDNDNEELNEVFENFVTSGSEDFSDNSKDEVEYIENKEVKPIKKPSHMHTNSSLPIAKLDLSKIKLNLQSQGQQYIPAKPKKLGKVEALIEKMKKQLNRSEHRTEKYKKYYRDLKEMVMKYKVKYDEMAEKINELNKKNSDRNFNGEITTKDLTGDRNNLNSSLHNQILNQSDDENNEEIEVFENELVQIEKNLKESIDQNEISVKKLKKLDFSSI